MIRLAHIFVISILLTFSLSAQDSSSVSPKDEMFELSLEELMNVKVSIASRKEMSQRESPGIITVITEEDIKSLGARDLMDVFRLVPGFDFAADIQNFVGLGVRGIWASEGKAAIFWDGIEVNDLLYGTVPFGGHYSVDNIKKIEIIRGPGSAVYGGTSEMAVIKITSKRWEQNGGQISAMYGQMDKDFGRIQASASVGKDMGAFKTYFNAYNAETRRSTGIQQDYYDPTRSYSMKGNSELLNTVLSGGMDYKEFSFNFLIDRHTIFNREYQYEKHAVPNIYNTYAANLKYNFNIGNKLKIIPQYQFRYNKPWAELDTISDGFYYNRYVNRQLFKIEAVYDPLDNLNIVLGTQIFNDFGKSISYAPDPSKTSYFSPNNKQTVSYNNFSAFAQGIYQTKLGNLTAGFRFDQHSLGFNAFVPRFGYTFVKNKLHLKLLAAQAFRTPYIANISSNDIKPEKTTTFEVESGYQIRTNLIITANAFYTTVKDILIYQYNPPNLLGGYVNGDVIGTHGIEIEAKYRIKKLQVFANYSLYRANSNSNVTELEVNKKWFQDPANANPASATMGFSPQKFNIVTNLNAFKWLDVNMSFNYLSKRYSHDIFNLDDNTGYLKEFEAKYFVNTFITFKNIIAKEMEIGIGCNDILNQKQIYTAPYTTFDPTASTISGLPSSAIRSPLPGPSREFTVRILYRF